MSETSGPGASAPGETSGGDQRGDAPERPSDSWIDRLMMAVGLKQSAAALRETLETILEDEDGDASLSTAERLMIRNILRLRETRVEDVMVPRSAIEAISAEVTLTELMIAFKANGHSRMPVYRETLDDAIGMIHIRDLMTLIATEATVGAASPIDSDRRPTGIHLSQVDLTKRLDATDLVRPVLFVPASMPVTDLLAKMQANRIQMALVIDEYGGVDGLASLEDIVETVVGDIEDEHDVDDDHPLITAVGAGGWNVDGRAELEEVTEVTGIDFSESALSEEVDTLGGLAFALFGRVPARGERVTSDKLGGVELEVLDADPRRITRLRIRRLSDGADDADSRPQPGAAATPPPK